MKRIGSRLFNFWKKIAHLIGVFQSRVILTFFYFTLFLPVGIILSLFLDLLQIKKTTAGRWVIKVKQGISLNELQEQF